jgi:methylthioribose-1-phosphate isomerase
MLKSLEYDHEQHTLAVLDQLKLPHEKCMVPVTSSKDAWGVIRSMQVRS